MNQEKKLLFEMAFFFLIVFVIFGLIIIKEKQSILFLPKIEQKINDYIEEKYPHLELKKENTKYEENKYITKVSNPKNKNHYFLITYQNKNITDTYEEDYKKGKTLLNHLNKIIEQEIKKETNENYKITINNTLDNFSEQVQKKLFEEVNLKSLKIYTLEIDITCIWDENIIETNISPIMTNLTNKNITPKNYTILITDKNDITKSVVIKNITYDSIKNNALQIIISDIINNKKTNILTENNIEYEYLN